MIKQQQINQDFIHTLQSAIGLLDKQQYAQLRKDAIALGEFLENPAFRIAVFGPFNYGKSTLLNALLGEKTLPIDLIPTTGAAILVKYGQELSTKITLTNGQEIREPGTKILQDYAILSDARRMRDDVASVEVYCPHPFLKTGVEFLDLPGTNDQEAQDNLVRDRLLGADLIIQLLDCRKLMTLGERENLRDWLLDRGINTVVFVVNFLNLLEPEEQKEVSNRMRFVAESFRADLPDGVSNLYRVDALPALRAKLKGDVAAAQTSGLSMFESALQMIVTAQQEKNTVPLSRIEAIAQQICQVLEAKKSQALQSLATAQEKQQQKIAIQQKAEKLIKQGIDSALSDFQSWLYLPKLLDRYQNDLAKALETTKFDTWRTEQFQAEIGKYQTGIMEWVKKASEFFPINHPGEIDISFPEPPQVLLPAPPDSIKPSGQKSRSSLPTAIATGLGWLLGGPVGAAVAGGATYILTKSPSNSPKSNLSNEAYQAQLIQAYNHAAQDYLTRFSEQAFATLKDYEIKVGQMIVIQNPEPSKEMMMAQYEIEFLANLLARFQQNLANLK
ncbi:dynamin [Planktothricoides sp. SR001]|uniref:dynamin family protein n=1 Tax=Planktothricoides sp. SR001 TaxID=1705388 RepID=UPI0006C03F80|nr:dynamin family protein [Planktothricoides sp. SR001]KOR38381.1 dynamin [Planktothricoides sp. SR001]